MFDLPNQFGKDLVTLFSGSRVDQVNIFVFSLFTVVIGFTLDEDPSVQMTAWTTTPWTLPSNLALAVHPDLDYVLVRDVSTQKKYILMEEVFATLFSAGEL